MTRIGKDSTIEEIAAVVSQALERAGISAVLSGGTAAMIYSNHRYESQDLDFVTSASKALIETAIAGTGFRPASGRYFRHPNTDYYLEFPAGPLSIGAEILDGWAEMTTDHGVIQILTPTQCVMDRLAAYFHWNDPQALEQALLVAGNQDIDLDAIEAWSEREGAHTKFETFKRQLQRM